MLVEGALPVNEQKGLLRRAGPGPPSLGKEPPPCPTHKRARPKNKQPRVSLAQALAASLTGAERGRGQDRKKGPASTHCWAAPSRAASACACRCSRRPLRAGCLDGSWKCRLLCSFSRSSNLCFIVSAGNPKQQQRNKEQGNSKQTVQDPFAPVPASIHLDDIRQSWVLGQQFFLLVGCF